SGANPMGGSACIVVIQKYVWLKQCFKNRYYFHKVCIHTNSQEHQLRFCGTGGIGAGGRFSDCLLVSFKKFLDRDTACLQHPVGEVFSPARPGGGARGGGTRLCGRTTAPGWD